MNITFIAQSGFIFDFDDIRISIDLWLDNPVNKIKIEDVAKIDYVFVSHDHSDHGLKPSMEIAKRDESYFISNNELMKKALEQGIIKIAPGSVGGLYKVGDLEIVQTFAVHSSDLGIPVGFIIKYKGKTIYHMGDTGYFSDLKVLKEMYGPIDVLFIPIGSRYTMGPLEASFAVRDLEPKITVPMHYNTMDLIAQNPEEFERLALEKCPATKVVILNPGDEFIV
jgi:L-ascorbate metabolism protein UlaG (beta-lactamase superfamily)